MYLLQRLTQVLQLAMVRACWLLCLIGSALMATVPAHAADFLDPAIAFKPSARWVADDTLEVSFDIAPGYYMYRERFQFTGAGAELSPVKMPPGDIKFDPTFNKDVETYRDRVSFELQWQTPSSATGLAVEFQGCADAGLCYPPSTWAIDIKSPSAGQPGRVKILTADTSGSPSAAVSNDPSATAAVGAVPGAASDKGLLSGGLSGLLAQGNALHIIAAFFMAGVLLSLTPCVLPMLPILSAILAGDLAQQAQPTRWRSLGLAVSYTLGMATIYTGLGIAAGMAGEGLAAYLQTPWVLFSFGAVMLAAALSMFGAFDIQLPSFIRQPLSDMQGGLPGGRLVSVFIMGGFSAVLVSPCVAAPLAGALVYISQSKDVWMGGLALFVMALGMSVPLLIMGATAGRWMPRGGAWMEEVKRVFGILLLALALWTIDPLLNGFVRLMLWGLLFVFAATLVWPHATATHGAAIRRHVRQAAAIFLGLIGLVQVVGAASGGSDLTQPLGHFAGKGLSSSTKTPSALPYRKIASTAELDQVLEQKTGVVMLDFYADWCKSCIEMEKGTLSDPEIQRRLKGAVLLKADVTTNTEEHRALLRRFGLFGPPGMIFFDAGGQEIEGTRVIGYLAESDFARVLDQAGL